MIKVDKNAGISSGKPSRKLCEQCNAWLSIEKFRDAEEGCRECNPKPRGAASHKKRSQSKRKLISFYVEPRHHANLEVAAEKAGVSFNEFCRHVLIENSRKY